MSTSTKNEEYIYELLETTVFEDLTSYLIHSYHSVVPSSTCRCRSGGIFPCHLAKIEHFNTNDIQRRSNTGFYKHHPRHNFPKSGKRKSSVQINQQQPYRNHDRNSSTCICSTRISKRKNRILKRRPNCSTIHGRNGDV